MKPAANISMRTIIPASWYTVSNGIEGEPSYTINVCPRQFDLHHPATVSSPRVTKRWREPTSWSRSSWRSNPSPMGVGYAYLNYNPNSGFRYYDGSMWPLSIDPAPEPIPVEVYNKAVNSALSKIKNQKVNLAQAFGEREQVVRMFENTCHRLGGAYRAFRRRDPKGFARALAAGSNESHLRNLPESFLEFQYGVKPLVSDVYGALDALNQSERAEESPYLMHVVGKASSRDVRHTVRSGQGNGMFQCEEAYTFVCRVNLYFVLDNPFIASLGSLGILNPAALAWELLPLSFVADWVVPVGPYLGLLDATAGYKFRAGCFSGLTKKTVRSYFQSGTGGYWRASWVGDNYHYDGYAYQRSLYDDFPMPQLTAFKPPWARDRTTHLADRKSVV